MLLQCPNCHKSSDFIRKAGRFYRSSDARSIQRYYCKNCGKHFSQATFSENYRQNKRRINFEVSWLFCSGMSQRRMALFLNTTRKTIKRKLDVLGLQAKRRQEKWLKNRVFTEVYFDDFETIEHTKLKPVSVPVLVSKDRKIIGFKVAKIPAKGHLTKASLKKYGPRKNEATKARRKLFCEVTQYLHPNVCIKSDCHPHYPDLVKEYFPGAKHMTHKGDRSSVYGMGELKKVRFDHLFSVNHTFAMFRYNMSRLIRKTWCTTKCLEALESHLWIYMDFHNRNLLPKQQ